MYVVFLIYCSFFVLLFAISFLSLFHHWLFIYLQWGWVIFSLFRLVLVWYWHWWQGLCKLYGIKDFNIIKTFLKEKQSIYCDICCYCDIKFVITWYKILVISPTPTSSHILSIALKTTDMFSFLSTLFSLAVYVILDNNSAGELGLMCHP